MESARHLISLKDNREPCHHNGCEHRWLNFVCGLASNLHTWYIPRWRISDCFLDFQIPLCHPTAPFLLACKPPRDTYEKLGRPVLTFKSQSGLVMLSRTRLKVYVNNLTFNSISVADDSAMLENLPGNRGNRASLRELAVHATTLAEACPSLRWRHPDSDQRFLAGPPKRL